MRPGFLPLFKNTYKQCFTRKYSQLPPELVVFYDDKLTLCWHPEKPFPYECSRPIPPKVSPPETPLKIGEKEIEVLYRKKDKLQIVEELAKLTYTCKHRWFIRPRDKKAKKTPKDRPWL